MTSPSADKYQALRSAKRQAMSLLLLTTLLFLMTSLSPHLISTEAYANWSLYIQCLQTMAEAAMVGGLADWFAVSALFKHVPIPLLSRHTNVIPRNKDQIAKNLSVFIQEKFLDPQTLSIKLGQRNHARRLARWLSQPKNGQLLSQLMMSFIQKILSFTEDKAVQHFLNETVRTALKQVDLSQSASGILQTLIKEGKHHALLEQIIGQLNHLLSNEQTQTMIAEGIVDWLKDKHPVKEKILPSELIGHKGAKLAIATISHLLNDIHHNPEHHLRHEFDAYTHQLIERLKNDPVMLARGEQIKDYLLNNTTFNTYLNDLWQSLKHWLREQIEQPDAPLRQQMTGMSLWLGKTLARDHQLQAYINQEIIHIAKEVLPQLNVMLSRHIQQTVHSWDSKMLSEQIELNIGKDLQKIRINGTLLGAVIGFILFIISHIQFIQQWFFN